ncbi:MAG TPA: hypothetical protein VGR00_02050, partial [Thermoanaerobaculia bacterium]|nr:hypothetical protein [Thermoanaerobaculia bacterium]
MTFDFVPPDGAPPPSVEILLAARESRRLDDPVRSLFGLAETFGTLRASSPSPFALRGRTDNVADPAGRYGLALTAVPPEGLLLAGETGVALWAANGVAAASRTNVTVCFTTPGRVQLTAYDESGFVRGTTTLESLSARTWQGTLTDVGRESQGDVLGDAELPLSRVELRVLAGEVTGYLSVVDDVTGDGLLTL